MSEDWNLVVEKGAMTWLVWMMVKKRGRNCRGVRGYLSLKYLSLRNAAPAPRASG